MCMFCVFEQQTSSCFQMCFVCCRHFEPTDGCAMFLLFKYEKSRHRRLKPLTRQGAGEEAGLATFGSDGSISHKIKIHKLLNVHKYLICDVLR